jgi:uncharacterized membrane protein
MKKYLSTGFIILLPIALTCWIVLYLFDLFTAPLYKTLEAAILQYEESHGLSLAHHDTLVIFLSRVTAFILTFLLILLLGFCGRKFFVNLDIGNRILKRIPFVGTLYRLTKDVTKAVFTTDQKAFKQTVLIPFPSADMHTLGFVTGGVPDALRKIIPEAEITVFVPTAPHPVSGYVLFCPKNAVYDVAVSTEETFKFLLSCGVILPQEKK